MRYVTPDLFRTLGIPLLRGRDFTDEDFGKNVRSVLINQKFADMIAKYREPMGLQIRNDDSGPQDPMTIVGIVGDVHQAGLDAPVRPEVYMLNDRSVNIFTSNTMNVVIRTEGDPTAALDAIRHEVAAMDPNLATYSVQTMETVLDNSIADRKFTRTLMMGFAVLGTLLAVMGIYSVLSYLVTQHTREIGIRLALGARPVNVVSMVVNQGIAVGAVGLVIGLLAGFGLMRLLSGILFGVKSYDLPTFASAAALLFVVVLLASYIPARRTTKVDPMIALRQD
jgi:putative ABC transport system permease protein